MHFIKKMVCTGNTIHIMKTWHMYPDTLSSKVNIQGSKIARERAREKNYLKITLIRYLTKFNEEWQNPRGCWQWLDVLPCQTRLDIVYWRCQQLSNVWVRHRQTATIPTTSVMQSRAENIRTCVYLVWLLHFTF